MFASLKIGSKLFLGFGLVMLLAASVGVLAMWRMANVIPQSRMLAEVEGPQLESLTHGERALHEMMLAIRTFMYTSDAAKLAEGQKLAGQIEEQLALAQTSEEKKGGAGDIEKFKAMRKNLADYSALVTQTARNDAAMSAGRKESIGVSTELAATIDQFAATALAELQKQIKGSASADVLDQHVHTVEVLTRLQKLVTNCRVDNLTGQATRDRKLVETAVEQFTGISACLTELEPLLQDEAERKSYAELTADVAKYQAGMTALLDLWSASDELGKTRLATSQSLVGLTEKATGEIVDTVKASADTTFKLLAATRTQVGIGMGLMLLCGALISWLITRALTAPIQQALPIFAAVEQGDLTQRVPVSTQDEVGQIGLQFNKVVDNLQRVIRQVTQAANEVAGAATQIAAGSEEIAHGMHEQASQTTQVSSAVEEMSSTIVEVARKSSDAAQTAEAAGRHAERGGEVVQQTVGGINQIAEVVRESAAAMTELGKSGQQIGEIIGVINDIADQTNLLALNAAIEAARAGEHGRGFAVVADEVRKLAERTTQATKQVTESVRTIQQSTTEAVQNMQRGTQRVDEGVEMARNAGDALASIVTGSREVSSMIQSIAAASEQQSAAAEQISRSVEQISAVTNQSSEGVSQAAQAAQQLSTKSEFLQQLVSQFKI